MKLIPSLDKYYTKLVRLTILLGLFLGVGGSAFMFANKDIAPDWDMVSVIYFLMRGMGGNAANLLSTDLFAFTINEHQPYLPMLIWGLDFKLFNSYGLLPLIVMQLFAVLSVVLTTGWSRPFPNPQSTTTLAISLCGCALMLSPMHWENLVWPNQVHLYSAVLLSVLALSVAVSISQRDWRYQIRQALLCSLFAVCATFSFGWGLVVWPTLWIHGLLSRWSWQGYLTTVLAGAVTIALYFSRFNVIPQHGDPTESILHPLSVVHFASLLLASPMVVVGLSKTLGYVVGYLFLAAFAYGSYRVYIQRKIFDARQQRSLLICLYCIGVCLMTALGRSDLASRYLLIPTLFIIALPGLLPIRTPVNSMGKQLVVLLFLFGTLGLSAASFFYDNAVRNRQFMIRDGSIAAAFGTKPLHRGLSPDKNKINTHVWPFFIEHHGDSPQVNVLTWPGKLLPEKLKANPSAEAVPQAVGDINFIANREGDPAFDIIHGWARLGPKGEREALWVIITNTSGEVVGLGTTGRERPDVAKYLKANWLDNLLTRSNRAGFSGLIRAQPGDELNLYAYKDGECHPFAKNVKAPEAGVAAPK